MFGAIALLAAGAGEARAGNTYSVLKDVAVTAGACNATGNPFAAFDISWWDSILNVFVLADRTNCSVDVFDANGGNVALSSTFQELFSVGGFQGNTGNFDTSGPDGIVTVNGRYIFAGDGDSTVKVIDMFQSPPSVIATISTGPSTDNRADEMAYDPRDHLILVANDAPTAPVSPFVTFISTTPQPGTPPVFGIVGQISFTDATGGLEQTAYSAKTHRFYMSVPTVGKSTSGEIAVISPRKRKVVGHFPLKNCQPAGLAIGPNLEAMVGCSNAPVQIVSLKTGKSLATFKTLSSADEVWFNDGSRQYFVAASNNKNGTTPAPVLGVVDAETHALDQLIPTQVGDHSVAADANLNHIFLPNVPTTKKSGKVFPNCTTGCVTIFNPAGEAVASQ